MIFWVKQQQQRFFPPVAKADPRIVCRIVQGSGGIMYVYVLDYYSFSGGDADAAHLSAAAASSIIIIFISVWSLYSC